MSSLLFTLLSQSTGAVLPLLGLGKASVGVSLSLFFFPQES